MKLFYAYARMSGFGNHAEVNVYRTFFAQLDLDQDFSPCPLVNVSLVVAETLQWASLLQGRMFCRT